MTEQEKNPDTDVMADKKFMLFIALMILFCIAAFVYFIIRYGGIKTP